MQPSGERPNRPLNGRPPLSRQRPSSGQSPYIQRRPPLGGIEQRPPVTREANTEDDLVKTQNPPVAQRPVYTPQPLSPTPQYPPAAQDVSPVPEANQTTPVSATPPISPPITQPEPSAHPAPSLSFTPPPKKTRSRKLVAMAGVLAIIILGAGIFGFVKVQAAKNNPDTVFREALDTNLSLSTLQSDTQVSGVTIKTNYDFSKTKEPVIASEASLRLSKGNVGIKSYGTSNNTYVSYNELPKSLSKNILTNAKDAWVRIRVNGTQPNNVPPILANMSDPRYQAFGPVVMANFEKKTRQQILDFIIAHKVYGYDIKKVTKQQVGDEKMFIYPLKLDVSYLKIASQSVAVSEGYDPAEVQAATDVMEELRGATITMHIRAGDHTVARFIASKNGKTKTISYGKYKTTTMPDEPQTNLFWQNFVPVQAEIDAKTSLTKAVY